MLSFAISAPMSGQRTPTVPAARVPAAAGYGDTYGVITHNAAMATTVGHFVASIWEGAPLPELMYPPLHELVAKDSLKLKGVLAPLGRVTGVESWGQNAGGMNLFRVTHEHGVTMWKVRFMADGLINGLSFLPEAEALQKEFAPRFPPWGHYTVLAGGTWTRYSRQGWAFEGGVVRYRWVVPGKTMQVESVHGTKEFGLTNDFRVKEPRAMAELRLDEEGHLFDWNGNPAGNQFRYRVVNPNEIVVEYKMGKEKRWKLSETWKRTDGATVEDPAQFAARSNALWEEANRRAEERRADAAATSPLQVLHDALAAANEEASRQADESGRSLDRTLQNMEADARRQQDRQAATSAPDMPRESAPRAQPSGGGAAAGANKPLVFLLRAPLKQPINGKNAACFSNVVTIPGPPGWGDMNDRNRHSRAMAMIDSYKAGFLSKCAGRAELESNSISIFINEYHEDQPHKEHQRLRAYGFPEVRLN